MRPTRGAVILHNAALELYVTVAGTCVVSAVMGLALSAPARSNEQIFPLLVVSIMSQLVFSGGMIPVTRRPFLDQLSCITQARWGYAALASTVDLRVLEPTPMSPREPHWAHTPGAWLLDTAMLAVLFLAWGALSGGGCS